MDIGGGGIAIIRVLDASCVLLEGTVKGIDKDCTGLSDSEEVGMDDDNGCGRAVASAQKRKPIKMQFVPYDDKAILSGSLKGVKDFPAEAVGKGNFEEASLDDHISYCEGCYCN